MRVLRSSQYPPPPGGPPLTIVFRDSDVVDTLESIREREITEEYFVAFDIFEIPDAEIFGATMKAMERMEECAEDEANQAIMYYWITAQLGRTREDGHVLSDKPAPLTPTQMRATYEQIVKHPNYKRQTLTAWAKDGTQVGVEEGRIV